MSNSNRVDGDRRTIRPHGKKIRELRQKKFGSREKFIDELGGNESELSLRRLGEIERGTAKVFPNTLHELARVLGTTYEDLLLRDEPSEGVTACESIALVEPDAPYAGLDEFTEKMAPFFLGRDADVEKLARNVLHRPLVIVTGPSGSGKSSLVRAGLIPRLREEGWIPLITRPEAFPFVKLANIIKSFSEPALRVHPCTQIPALDEVLQQHNGFFSFFDEWLISAPQIKLLVFVNQFEEIFTRCQNKEMRMNFLRAITNLPHPDRFRVVVTLRNDYFYQAVDETDQASESGWVGQPFPVRKMSSEQLKLIIREPAARKGIAFETGLVDQILRDAGDTEGILPLLEFCLLELWSERTHGNLTFAMYEKLGGLHGCIVRRADEVFDSLSSNERANALRILPHLVDIGKDSRIRLTIDQLCRETGVNQHNARAALEPFRSARLLVLDGEEDSNACHVEFAHEAVFRTWEPLQQLLAKNRNYFAWRQDLRMRTNAWQAGAKRNARLLADALLQEAKTWLTQYPNEALAEDEKQFIAESETHQQSKEEGMARERVERLLSAKSESLRNLIEQMREHSGLLHERLVSTPSLLSPEQICRLRLAILKSGDRASEQIDWLSNYIYQADPYELVLIRDELAQFKSQLTQVYWAVACDRNAELESRFRAACMLAGFDPSADTWNQLAPMVAQRLLQEPPRFLRLWIDAVRPIGDRLRNAFRMRIHDGSEREFVRSAAFALGQFSRDNIDLLAEYVSEANAAAYAEFFSRLPATTGGQAHLIARLKNIVGAEYDSNVIENIQCEFRQWLISEAGGINSAISREASQIFLGKKRAGAAITAIRLGHHELALDVLRLGDDPEAMSQFVARLPGRGVRVDDLLHCLELANGRCERFGLLLSLGAFNLSDIPLSDRVNTRDLVGVWHASDPHSSIHSACDWLLRRWGSPIPNAADHTKIESSEWHKYNIANANMTLIRFEPAIFSMGSPDDEIGRSRNEAIHLGHIKMPFEICDRPVTRSEFMSFLHANKKEFDNIDEYSPSPQHPVVAVTWHEAVLYCRWLTEMAGLSESDQCYSNPDTETNALTGYPTMWTFRPDRFGFRLPTEAEWEFACRGGAGTTYHFGNDSDLLTQYAAFSLNHDQSTAPVAVFRPNMRGMFDMHGNVFEWCDDLYQAHVADSSVVERIKEGQTRVVRGGGWVFSNRMCRCAFRIHYPPSNRYYAIGFRVARTLAKCGRDDEPRDAAAKVRCETQH